MSTFQARQLFLVCSAWENSVLPVDKITPTTKVLKRNYQRIYGFCPQRQKQCLYCFNKVRSTAFVHTLICSNRDSIYMLACKWNCNVTTEIYPKTEKTWTTNTNTRRMRKRRWLQKWTSDWESRRQCRTTDKCDTWWLYMVTSCQSELF